MYMLSFVKFGYYRRFVPKLIVNKLQLSLIWAQQSNLIRIFSKSVYVLIQAKSLANMAFLSSTVCRDIVLNNKLHPRNSAAPEQNHIGKLIG